MGTQVTRASLEQRRPCLAEHGVPIVDQMARVSQKSVYRIHKIAGNLLHPIAVGSDQGSVRSEYVYQIPAVPGVLAPWAVRVLAARLRGGSTRGGSGGGRARGAGRGGRRWHSATVREVDA